MTPSRKLDVTGTFGATGAATLGSTLAVTGAATLSSTLAVTGATTFAGSVTIGDATTGQSVSLRASSYGSNGLARFYGTDTGEKLQMGALTHTSAFIYTPASVSLLLYSHNAVALTLGAAGAATFASTLAVTGATTLSSTLSMADNVIERPRFTDYAETYSTPAISGGTLTLNIENGNVFRVSLTAAITTLTISNPSGTGNACSFTLIFNADGTARAVTWPAAVKWPGGTAPTLTSTASRSDMFVFYTNNAGTTWYAMTAAQNFVTS